LYTSVGKIVKLWRKPHGSSFFSPPFWGVVDISK
jgi:hypothetical protein